MKKNSLKSTKILLALFQYIIIKSKLFLYLPKINLNVLLFFFCSKLWNKNKNRDNLINENKNKNRAKQEQK